jgi:twitching motility protein PilI
MADKDALRALQTRLAERMQQVRDERPGLSWLAVSCAGLGLLLPLKQAGEIFDPGVIVPVPHTQAWFRGVINHRGGICTVVDFAGFLGLRGRDDPPPPGDNARLVALNVALGVNCTLLVDRLEGLRHEADLTRIESDDNAAARPAFAPARWRDAAGRAWQEINLAELARQSQFLAIAG